ncbi:MAG: hypothetical protein IPK83_11005 [Planctomycetes bacterium]|nr:hypothetical protein [Planctomycetota bacterium]
MARIRWHQLYILLAAFDALVILAGIGLHHQTLSAFGGLLRHTATLDARQREIASLSQALNQLSLHAFRADADAAKHEVLQIARQISGTLGALKSRTLLNSKRMKKFWELVTKISIEQNQLTQFVIVGQARTGVGPRDAIASIEKHRLQALRILSGEQESLLSQSAKFHLEHAQIMDRQDLFERVLAAALVATLGVMIWYTRRLQKTDQQLREVRERVETERRDRLAAIGEVCTGVAHGIQNPLAAISSSTELMIEMGRMDADSRRRAEDVHSECGRLSRRVRRLLTFARMPESDRSLVGMAPIVREIVTEMFPRFEEKRIRVEVEIDSCPLEVIGDDEELGSILLELLSNAVDHTPAGGSIRICMRRASDVVELYVSDSGAGVPIGTAAHIFDLFFTTRSGGSGVGSRGRAASPNPSADRSNS